MWLVHVSRGAAAAAHTGPLLLASPTHRPIHLAALQGHATLIREALCKTAVHEKGRVTASVNATDAQGNTPMHIASLQGNAVIIQCLLAQGGEASLITANSAKLTPRDLALTPAIKEMLS